MHYKDLVGWFVGVTFLTPNKHKDFSVYIRDLAYSNTDRKEIAFAINGYFEVADVVETCKWEREVRAHLALVFKKTVNLPNEEVKPKTLDQMFDEYNKGKQSHPLFPGLYPHTWRVDSFDPNKYPVIC